jgi:hypothetical protein
MNNDGDDDDEEASLSLKSVDFFSTEVWSVDDDGAMLLC